MLNLNQSVTCFVGENGSGKSTLLEAIAQSAGFNLEGGSKNFSFQTASTISRLSGALRLHRGVRRERTGFFLRAESMFNVASEIDRLDKVSLGGAPIIDSYGGKSLHDMSHGESFLAVIKHRFGPGGLYLLDEPESALSPNRQLVFLKIMHESVQAGSQYIFATHSPILMAYPGATIYLFDENRIRKIDYEDTEHYQLTRDFLQDRARFLHHLLKSEPT